MLRKSGLATGWRTRASARAANGCKLRAARPASGGLPGPFADAGAAADTDTGCTAQPVPLSPAALEQSSERQAPAGNLPGGKYKLRPCKNYMRRVQNWPPSGAAGALLLAHSTGSRLLPPQYQFCCDWHKPCTTNRRVIGEGICRLRGKPYRRNGDGNGCTDVSANSHVAAHRCCTGEKHALRARDAPFVERPP